MILLWRWADYDVKDALSAMYSYKLIYINIYTTWIWDGHVGEHKWQLSLSR